MKSTDLSNYLKGKISSDEIKGIIYQALHKIVHKIKSKQSHKQSHYELRVIDNGATHTVSSIQFMHLFNDFIAGEINRYELYFILDSIENSSDLIVENRGAMQILYQLASPNIKKPVSINYIKSVIYRP